MSQDKVQKIKDTIQQAWCEGDINPKDKFGDFLNRAAIQVSQLFAIPELTLLTDEEILTAMQTAHPEGEEYPRWRKLEGRLLREVRNVAQAQRSKNKKELGQ